MTMTLGAPLRARGQDRAVTPLELFFDLVYVFAISQLSHHLFAHPDLRTGAETVVLTLAVVYTWEMIAWLSNWLAPDQRSVQVLLLGLMLGSLFMSSGIETAFEDRAWLFVGGYLTVQTIRSLFSVVVFPVESAHHRHFVNALIWELFSGALWLAGAFAHDELRLLLWASAAALAHVGLTTAHPMPGRTSHLLVPSEPDSVDGGSNVSGSHLLERLRLFFLIVLGETLLTSGTTFAEGPLEPGTVAALVVTFLGAAALWWCYFDRAEGMGRRASEHGDDAGAVAALGTVTLTLMVLALIGIAVKAELAIGRPGVQPETSFQVLAFGGAGLFLLAQVIFLLRLGEPWPWSRMIGIVALVALAVGTAGTTHLIAGLSATLVLLAVAVADTVADTRPSAPPRRAVAPSPE